MQTDHRLYRTCVYPLAIFMGFTLLLAFGGEAIRWDHPEAAWWRRAPELLLYPIQTVACGWWLWHVRKEMPWDWAIKPCLIAIPLGLIGIGLWMVPYFTGWIPQEGHGFAPEEVFGHGSALTLAEYAMRFIRAAVVVAFAEELFWRGFLMRWCINRDFPQSVAIGTHSWLAYGVTTAAFMLIHNPADWGGAFIYGSLTYLLVIKTKRITPAIVMHGVANATMGICAICFNLPHLW